MKKWLFAITLFAASWSTQSHAALITQNFEKSYLEDFTAPTITETVYVPANSFVFSVNPFDTTLGTLNSVRITWEISASFSGVALVNNDSAVGRISFRGNTAINTRTYDAINTGNANGLDAGGGLLEFGESSGVTELFDNPSLINFPLSLGHDVFAAALGMTDFDIMYTGAFEILYRNFETVTAGATGIATVVYDYTPTSEVPAPGALLLMSLGLLGAFGIRKNKTLPDPLSRKKACHNRPFFIFLPHSRFIRNSSNNHQSWRCF